jgi:hypothetical protein
MGSIYNFPHVLVVLEGVSPKASRNLNEMVTSRLDLASILVCSVKSYIFCSSFGVLVRKLSQVQHLPSYIPYTYLEILMEWSQQPAKSTNPRCMHLA